MLDVGAVKTAPAVVAAAPSLLKQGGKALKSAEKAVKKAAKPVVDKAYANADRVDKVGRVVADVLNPNQPPESSGGKSVKVATEAGKHIYDKVKEGKRKIK